jgi:non-specific serine/threonine protein kinase
MTDLTGLKVSHYKVFEQLGVGGMGVVYRAEDTRLGREVALKFLSESLLENKEILQRFQREARAASSLAHPNICTIFDVGDFEGRPFIAMELLQGKTLRELMRGAPLDVESLMEWAIQITHGLQSAHERGIIHRDIKPANIFISEQGLAKITDFGLAKLLPNPSTAQSSDWPTETEDALTSPGTAMGTISFMSPEQARGEDLDVRTDLFSLGVALYEMATGQQPFRGKTTALVFDAILNQTPETPSEGNPGIDFELERIISKALEKNRSSRYQSAQELLVDLLKLRRDLASGAVPVQRKEPGNSIGVLAFADLSPGRDQEYFCEGLAEELLNALNRLEGLRVASRTSAFALKNKDLDIHQVGTRLGVASILEGSVRKAGDRIRVSAQLIDTKNGYHIWSDQYDRNLEDIFDIQEEIAHSIVQALKVKLAHTEAKALENAPTRSVEAFDNYLRGRQFFYRSKRESILLALEMFSRAIEKDSNYALAFAGKADCHSYLYMYFEHQQHHLKKALETSEQSLTLDPHLAEAHAARGLAVSLNQEYEDAEREFEYAILLNQQLFEAYYFYARTCFSQGKLKKAANLYLQASQVNPHDFQALNLLGFTYRCLKLHDKAEDAYARGLRRVEKHLELNPNDARALYLGAEALLAMGKKERAALWAGRALSLDPGDPYLSYGLACFNSRLGEKAKALEYFEMALDSGFAHREWIENDSDLDPIRNHPRFEELLERLTK